MDAKTLGDMPIVPGPITSGLTLRQHFAGLAMQGMLSNPEPQVCGAESEKIAQWAAQVADALLAELAKDAQQQAVIDATREG